MSLIDYLQHLDDENSVILIRIKNTNQKDEEQFKEKDVDTAFTIDKIINMILKQEKFILKNKINIV